MENALLMTLSLIAAQRRYSTLSIIYDALKKSQNKRTQNKPKVKVARRSFKLSRMQLIILLTGTCLFLIAAAINMTDNTTLNLRMAKNKPVIKTTPIPKLKLDGVFLSDSETLAMINKHSYHIGDALHGMKVVNITLDTVTLQNAQKSIVLRNDISQEG